MTSRRLWFRLSFWVLVLAPTCAVWLSFVVGNRLSAHPFDATTLFLYLLVFHGTVLSVIDAVARGGLAIFFRRRGSPPPGRRWGCRFGAGLGALVGMNAILAFPVTYGPFNSREQPFMTPLGTWNLLVFAVAPIFLGWGLAGLSGPRRRRGVWLGAAWRVAFVATLGLNRTWPGPCGVDLRHLAATPVADSEAGRAEPRRVVLLGFDGLDWNVLSPLLDRGELPHLRRLVSRGAVGALETAVPTLSPAIWTTLATGRRPEEHRIFAFSKFRLPGVETPIGKGPYLSTPNWWFGLNRLLLQASYRGWVGDEMFHSTERRVPALWDVADHYGLSTGMVGWHASWPVAEPKSGGFRVSDFGPRSGSFFPYDEGLALSARSRSVDAVRRPAGDDFVRSIWQRSYDTVWRSSELLRRAAPRFAALFVRFPDPVLHHAWRGDRFFLNPGMPPLARLPVEVIEAYRFVDDLLGILEAAIEPGSVIVLVSDHGFLFDGRQHHHEPPGVLVVSGPGVRSGGVIEGASIYDLFPTILNLLELPVAAPATGRVLREAFVPGALGPSRRVAAYDWYRPDAGRHGERSQAVEDEELRRIRSLGYVN